MGPVYGGTVLLPATLLGTGTALPGRVVTTAEVAAAAYPDMSAEELIQRTGIRERRWAGEGETHATLAIEAVRRALDAAGMVPGDLERIVLTYCTGGDMHLPATANAVGDGLDLHGTCDLFDVNNACTGFLTALDMAARCVATGMGPVAVIATEVYSRHLHPSERRSYAVFGDGAAATIVGPAAPGTGAGMVSSFLRNDGVRRGSVSLAHAGLTGEQEWVKFGVSNKALSGEATDALVDAVHQALGRAGLTVDDMDWVLPHQPNGRMLEVVVDRLGVSADKLVPVVDWVGSIGSASVPVSLDVLMRSGRVRPGDRVLLAAVGSGIGYGAMVWQVGT